MKQIIILILAGLSPLLLQQSKAADPIKLEPFHSIIVSSEIKAEIVFSDTESIEPEFKNADPEDLLIEVVDSVLKVRMKTGNYKSADLKARITFKEDLRLLEAHARAQIWSREDLPPVRSIAVKLSNGGEMRFNLVCDSLSATLSQGSIIHLNGNTRALHVKCSTNATFSGYEFESEIASVAANSTGKVKVNVSKYLNANASSKGFIGYIGETAKVDEKTSLRGEIIRTVQE